MLVEQYRMNSAIMQWSSQFMYDGRLVAHESVANHSVSDLVKDSDMEPLMLIDTAGCLMHESVEDSQTGITESKSNFGEADLVLQVISELKQQGMAEAAIGVISPYSAQVSEIRRQLKLTESKIEVSTVDGFQGREKEVIIISMVRSNPRGEIGFLSNEKRMNVAVTRAKRLCVLIGDSGTVSKNDFLKSLVEYFRAHGQCRTGFDYLGNDFVRQGYGQKPSEPKQGGKSRGEKPTAKEKPRQETAEDRRKKEEFYDSLVQFKYHSSECEMSFRGLNSYERQIVHEICEQLGLRHESKGDQQNRVLHVQKEAPERSECEAPVLLSKKQKQKQAKEQL